MLLAARGAPQTGVQTGQRIHHRPVFRQLPLPLQPAQVHFAR